MSKTEDTGATITEMDAGDLVGRLAINSHGAEFIITGHSDGAFLAFRRPVAQIGTRSVTER